MPYRVQSNKNHHRKQNNTMIRQPFLAILLLYTFNANAELKEIKLPTATDGDVRFLFDTDTKLPVGASDARAQVVTAALVFLPKEKGQPVQWTWHYEIKFRTDARVKSITVEDERDAKTNLLIQDDNPSIEGNVWSGFEKSTNLSKDVFSSMQAKDPWMLVRRLTVTYDDNVQSKLHQLIIETQPMRMKLLDDLMIALKANAQ